MSKYEWEQGSLKLPTAEFAKVRKAIEAADRAHKERIFDLAQEFWKSLSVKAKRDSSAYEFAARVFCFGDYRYDARGRAIANVASRVPQRDELLREALFVTLLSVGCRGARPGVPVKPRRVLKTDIEFPTNRTTSFRVGDDAVIAFNREKSTVTWAVRDNNHAVERARAEPLAHALFGALSKVRWTRGTGGVVRGNDEYNQDRNGGGDGAHYVTYAVGPIGESEAPFHCVEYLDGKGQRRTTGAMIEMAAKRAGRRAA